LVQANTQRPKAVNGFGGMQLILIAIRETIDEYHYSVVNIGFALFFLVLSSIS
jgi:hypothetical protein